MSDWRESWSDDFVKKMQAAIEMSHYKYGSARKTCKRAFKKNSLTEKSFCPCCGADMRSNEERKAANDG